MALKIRIRAQYGRGVPCNIEIGPFGEVHFLGLRADPDQLCVCAQLFDAASCRGETPPAGLPPRLAALMAEPATGAVRPARCGIISLQTARALLAGDPAPNTS